jgi:hypothetical protein
MGCEDDRVARRPAARKLDEAWDRRGWVEDIKPEIRVTDLELRDNRYKSDISNRVICAFTSQGSPGMSFDTNGVGTVGMTASNASTVSSPDRTLLTVPSSTNHFCDRSAGPDAPVNLFNHVDEARTSVSGPPSV